MQRLDLAVAVDGSGLEWVVIKRWGAREMRVGIVGKGGSGKSLVAGTVARLLARRGHAVIALDLDLMPGMSMSLGLEPRDDPMFANIAGRDENVAWGWGLRSDIDVTETVVQQSAVAPDGVRLLQMGKVRALPPEECLVASVGACFQMVRSLQDQTLLPGWTIVGDHPAGMTQSTGPWVAYADTVVVVVEPAEKSVLSGRRLLRLRDRARVLLVANKVTGAGDVDYIESACEQPLAVVVPSDAAVSAADAARAPLIDHAPASPAVASLQLLTDQLERGARHWGRRHGEGDNL